MNIISNSDILHTEFLKSFDGVDMEGICFALARWSPGKDGKAALDFVVGIDTWIFKGKIRSLPGCDFPMGQYGCDWRLASILSKAGYFLMNVGVSVVSLHFHAVGVENDLRKVPVPGDRVCVPYSTLERFKKTRITYYRDCFKGVIGYSLFGNNERYTVGAVENAVLARYVYPGWVCRFYVDDSVPAQTKKVLCGYGAEVVEMPRSVGLSGVFWRFLVADDGFDCWVVRDVDSRLGYRERRAVDEWVESDYNFHIMKDHPGHKHAIIASAFGGKRGAVGGMKEKVGAWQTKEKYGDDEEFLSQVVYPLVKDRALTHCLWGKDKKGSLRSFPTPLEDLNFVGEVIEGGQGRISDRNVLVCYLFSREAFDEEFYLSGFPDVADVVKRGLYGSGYDHYLVWGARERRSVRFWHGRGFDEGFYLSLYPDVAEAVRNGSFGSGIAHFVIHGCREGREFRFM